MRSEKARCRMALLRVEAANSQYVLQFLNGGGGSSAFEAGLAF